MSPMSYSEIIARCVEEPVFFLGCLCWISFFMGVAFSVGKFLAEKFLGGKNKPD